MIGTLYYIIVIDNMHRHCHSGAKPCLSAPTAAPRNAIFMEEWTSDRPLPGIGKKFILVIPIKQDSMATKINQQVNQYLKDIQVLPCNLVLWSHANRSREIISTCGSAPTCARCPARGFLPFTTFNPYNSAHGVSWLSPFHTRKMRF